jgi:hypothetical protein
MTRLAVLSKFFVQGFFEVTSAVIADREETPRSLETPPWIRAIDSIVRDEVTQNGFGALRQAR